MDQPRCRVCAAPADAPPAAHGERVYCERHSRRFFAWPRLARQVTAVLTVGLLLFVGLVSLLAPMLNDALGHEGRIAAGLVLALVPAFLWLSVFSAQDREHPEPKLLLLKVFLLGALLAGAVGQPLITRLFRVSEWTAGSVAVRLAAGILVVGAIQEALKYAAVRHTVYGSREYDRPIDGIVYAAAAGLGYAMVIDVAFVVENAGADLGGVALRDTINSLAQASFAGITGYFLGRAKFDARGPLWMPAGLALACVLNGIVSTALGAVSRDGLKTTPARGLVLAACVAALTFGVLLALMHRHRAVHATGAAA